MPLQNIESEPMSAADIRWMTRALEMAQEAASRGEVPVGAVIVFQNREIACGANDVEHQCNAMRHAEIIALEMAQKALGDWRLTECTLYVTKEPCAMCAGAMVNCRLGRLVFGSSDPRMGAAGGAMDITGFPGMLHRVNVTCGVLEPQCTALLKDFFRQRRQGAPKILAGRTRNEDHSRPIEETRT